MTLDDPESSLQERKTSVFNPWWVMSQEGGKSKGATFHVYFTSHPSCVTHSVVKGILDLVSCHSLAPHQQIKKPAAFQSCACLSLQLMTEGNAGADMVFFSRVWSREIAVCTPCPLGIHPTRDSLPWSLPANHSIFSCDTFRLRGCLLEQCCLNLFHLKPLRLKVFI